MKFKINSHTQQHALEGGSAETLTLNNKWSGRGQSVGLIKLYLLKPSAPPQVQ